MVAIIIKLPIKKRKYFEILLLNDDPDVVYDNTRKIFNDNDNELVPLIVHNEVKDFKNELSGNYNQTIKEQNQNAFETSNTYINVYTIIQDAKSFDHILEDPVSDFEVSFNDFSDSGENNNANAEKGAQNDDVDVLGETLLELISNADDNEDDLDSCTDLFENNYKIKDTETEEQTIDIQQKINNTKIFREKTSSFINPALGESVLVAPKDDRKLNFLHIMDKTTFTNNLETIAEVSLFELAGGGSSSCPFGAQKVKRGGLRHFFHNEMKTFNYLHPKSVDKRLRKQRIEFLENPVTLQDLTPRKAPRPKLHFYKDFINVRANKFDDKIVQELLKIPLQPRIHPKNSSTHEINKKRKMTSRYVPDVFGNLDDTSDTKDDNNNESSDLVSSTLSPPSSESSILSQSLSSSFLSHQNSNVSMDSSSSISQFNDTNLNINNSGVTEEFNSSQSMPSFL